MIVSDIASLAPWFAHGKHKLGGRDSDRRISVGFWGTEGPAGRLPRPEGYNGLVNREPIAPQDRLRKLDSKANFPDPRLPHSMMRILLPALIACGLAVNASAATLAGTSLPDTYMVDGQRLTLNGVGLRTLTFLNIKAYIAGLYLIGPTHDAKQILMSRGPRVIILKFIRAGSKERVEKQYREGEAENCGKGGCDPSDAADFERLVAAAPAVNPGDTSTFVFTGKGVRVYANDRMIGDFANLDLAYRLLAGFIGDHPPTPSLRRQLLGLPEE